VCDAAHRVCDRCSSAGVTWQAGHDAFEATHGPEDPNTVYISGFGAREGDPAFSEVQDSVSIATLAEQLGISEQAVREYLIHALGGAQELLQEVEREIGSLPPDHEFAVAAFWTVASGRAHSARAKAQRRLEDHRRVRIRHLTSTGPGSAAPTLIQDAAHDPYAREVLQKNAKLE
ncbi:unnamed protein product, partial [Durusdinium trenchii]